MLFFLSFDQYRVFSNSLTNMNLNGRWYDWQTAMERSLEQLKHIERISRQTRHHQIQLNQAYNQRLQRDLTCLNHDYQQNCWRLETQQKLEQQRERLLNVTFKQIAREKRRPTLSTMNTTTTHCTIEPLSKHSGNETSSSSLALFTHPRDERKSTFLTFCDREKNRTV